MAAPATPNAMSRRMAWPRRILSSLRGGFGATSPERAQPAPIPFHPEVQFQGIGNVHSTQPDDEVLLRNAIGWADIGIRAIANRVAAQKFEVIERRRDQAGTVIDEIIDDHPLKFLLDRWSETYSSRQSLRLVTQYILTVGASYVLKVGPSNQALSEVRELYVMPSQRLSPVWSEGRIIGFNAVAGDGGEIIPIPADDVVHFWLPDPENPHGPEGYIGPQGTTLDASKFSTEHVRSHFERDATPRVVLESDKEAPQVGVDQRQRFQAGWREAYSGRSRGGSARGLPAVLPPGFIAKVLDAHESQKSVVPIMEYMRDQIMMALGVPRSVVGDVVDANRAAAETNLFTFDLHTVSPLTDLIADALTYQLARPVYGPDIFIRFTDFLMADKTFELAKEKQDLELKVVSTNEVREERGLDPSSWGELPVGAMGDAPYDGTTSLSMEEQFSPAPDDTAPDDSTELEDDPEPERVRAFTTPVKSALNQRQALRFSRAWLTVLAAQEDAVLAALSRAGLERSHVRQLTVDEVLDLLRGVMTPERWRDLYDQTTEEVRRQVFLQTGNAELQRMGLGDQRLELTERTADILARDGVFFQYNSDTTTLKLVGSEILRALEEGTLEGEALATRARRIREAVGEGFRTRARWAETIARTETAAANQMAHEESWVESGVVQSKRWLTSLDGAVRDSHASVHGQTVPLNGQFRLGSGAQATGPADPSLPAEDRINCRCRMVPVFPGE